ncbi:MAG: response regulator transcription factor [Ruminiclostridium sp.]|nr:response regulator transcription factor [Ruminiclostridium sp.]
MRIAVCDDEKYFRDTIYEEINSFFNSLDVLCVPFSDGDSLIEATEKGQRFDAVFLDIEMSGTDGMKTAARLHRFSADLPVIFLTSHTELAMDGYEVGAFRFLQKPVKKEKLWQTLADLKALCSEKTTISLKESGEEYFISPEEIICAEADNNTVRFITCEQEYRVRMKISEAVKLLEGSADYFCRIHRSVVVNLGHIVSRNDKEIRLDNNSVYPVSKSYSEELKSRLMQYIRINAR